MLDTGPAVDFMLGEPGAKAVADLLRRGSPRMATVNLAEVVDVLVRVFGVDADDAAMQVGELAELVEPVPPTVDAAVRAGELRARVFQRVAARVSLADCFVVAISRPGDLIATSDPTLARIAAAEGFAVTDLSGQPRKPRRLS